ncbi:hypothetical protein [Micropruina sp.]|uniref:hypothetical protein n=1 Tax=Micropruina sp. TaxID=2737536 RepID=UPI0039E4C089
MDPIRLTKEDLLVAHPDPEWRRSFYEFSRLTDFLSGCILNEKFKLPDELVSRIHLTDFGNKVMQKLITKNEVPPKEARTLCLLKLHHIEPLVDVKRSRPDDLREIINDQLRSRSILLPLIFGRQLYDRYASLFEDAQEVLTHRDTLRLLEEMPIGVFQSGVFISGPYGLLRSRESRWLVPSRSVGAFHCSDITCPAVHRVLLSTDHSASIVEHAPTMERVLDQFGADHSDWQGFIDSIDELERLRFDDQSQEPIALALSDLLSDGELRTLLADLLDNTSGCMRSAVQTLGLVGKAQDIVTDLDRPRLTQILLLASNQDLISRIDHLIATGQSAVKDKPPHLDVHRGEIRRLKTNRAMTYGTFALYPELSAHGIRFMSSDFSIGPLRLKRLVEELYRLDDPAEVDELQWQLRDTEGDDPQEQLEEYIGSATPEEVIRHLVLARRTNQVLASERLGIDFDGVSDDDFVNATLWKLGFYSDAFEDRNQGFWEHHNRLKRYAQVAGIGARLDAVELRAIAANYFIELEGVLDDSLVFTTWALTTDHVSTEHPFAYAPKLTRSASLTRLNSYEAPRAAEHERIELTDSNTLYPLIRGFGTLADLLADSRLNEAQHLRSRADYPGYSKYTNLKSFPFLHNLPFLDLLPKAQERLVDTLKYVRSTLEAAKVHSVRNDYMHYRASILDLSKLHTALEAVERSVARLEADGLCRLAYGLVGQSGDAWDRRVFTLENSRGRQIAFARPCAFDWNQMPSLRHLQYVVPAAIFARPNEMLRFTRVFETEYADYWQDYPKRRPRRQPMGAAVTSAPQVSLA